jgi:predicted phosphoadenosine phosphosulfate sulfurtransferase
MKKGLGINVYQAASKRIEYLFDFFPKIYVSFSGGKDSTVMLHMVAQEARKRGRRVGCLIIDLEAQYKRTIDHVQFMTGLYQDVLDIYWVCLPIALRNAVSVYQPKWLCWDPDAENIWVRQLPVSAISNINFFPFFSVGMEFEDFVPKFGDWYANGEPCACLVGIRADESLNRYRTIASEKKEMFAGKKWTTKIYGSQFLYNAYPIYDWKTQDVWVFHQKTKAPYNSLYDIMHQAGLSIHQQRICQPYGDDQRRGLWLYHVIEPETWAKIVARVSGANSGSEFVQFSGNASGQIKISKPDGHTWESYCEVILDSLPEHMAEHYRNKIHVFLRWWEKNGYPNGIPDQADAKLESARKAPSWRRIAKMLLRNDYWAKGLSFSQTKHGFHYQQYLNRIKKEREEIKNASRLY